MSRQPVPRRPNLPDRSPTWVIVGVGVLAILGALWIVKLVAGLVMWGLQAALIGLVVYVAVRLAVGRGQRDDR